MTQSSVIISDRARADSSHAGKRLDQVAALLFPDHSRARLQTWIRSGELKVNGLQAKPTQRVSGGELLVLEARPARQIGVRAQAIPLDIIEADSDIIVLNKPAGLVVHPAAGNPDGTLQNALLHFDPELAALPRAGIVHRLDKDTSGVMVVARSLQAHTRLVEQLQQRSMSRKYRALAGGCITAGGTVDAPIGRHPRDRKRMAVVRTGKPAITHYRVLRRYLGVSYLDVALESGRTHQIRVHLAHIGHSLVGDPVYGRPIRKKRELPDALITLVRSFPRQALHANRLMLIHPSSLKEASFEAPLPRDMLALLQSLDGFE